MRENLTLAKAAALVGKPAERFRLMVRGPIRKNRPEPQPPARFAYDVAYEISPQDGRWWVIWRESVWGDGKLVYSIAASAAVFDSEEQALAEALVRRAAITPS